MARINLEDELFASIRIQCLAQIMGWEVQMAIGALCLLWHESQNAMRVDGSGDEIILWTRLRKKRDKERIIAALVDDKVRFLKKIDENRFEISGNCKQIDNRVKNLNNAVKGGLATKEKWETIKKRVVTDSERRPIGLPIATLTAPVPASPEQALPIQSNPTQSSDAAQGDWNGTEMPDAVRETLAKMGVIKKFITLPVQNQELKNGQ